MFMNLRTSIFTPSNPASYIHNPSNNALHHYGFEGPEEEPVEPDKEYMPPNPATSKKKATPKKRGKVSEKAVKGKKAAGGKKSQILRVGKQLGEWVR
jgi:hypothetical protein